MRAILLITALALFCVHSLPKNAEADSKVIRSHGLAMHGDLKYGPDFKHFDYADPDAPKGGDVWLAGIGTFDSLNPFILKGLTPAGIGNLFDTLTLQSDDEPFSEYGLIAETIEVPEDRAWVIFKLRPEARFHDGSPLTVEDVIFTFEILKTQGHPFYRSYYANVVKAEKVGERKVKFTFTPGENHELPLIIGQMPVLSKAYWSTRDFAQTTLEPPLGNGPYKIIKVDPGRSITYGRVENYWAANLPVNGGRHNFGTLRYDYYRDTTVALQAFKACEYDLRQENIAKDWATAYDFPAVREGEVIKEEIPHERPTGMQGFVFNTRRSVFQSSLVRQALAYAFDFPWTNQNLFYGAYKRTTSYFSNSELASSGLPTDEERAILLPFKEYLPQEVFTQSYSPPTSDGSGDIRINLRTATKLLRRARCSIQDRRLVQGDASAPLDFEILLVNPGFERIVLPFVRNLKKLGITARVRTVDSTQYQNRLENFDFDMVIASFTQSLSPGNEQRTFWSSEAADQPGSRNLAGIADPVVDELIELIISAPDRQSLVQRTRALDRVLLWGHYVIPQWHLNYFRVAYWNKFGRPKINPKYSLGFDTWWVEPKKAKLIATRRGSIR
jgi:microcin C transport system substrate-binding protein